MKAITVKQPWAHLIVSGLKDIENRSWKTNFRGTVLIHSSKAKTRHKHTVSYLSDEQLKFVSSKQTLYSLVGVDDSYLKYGSIIGEVEIVDCVQNSKSIWAEPSGWHWVLANAKMYDEPILNVKGKLSFWEFEPVTNGAL